MATQVEVGMLRRLVGDTAFPQAFTDQELADLLDEAPACPVPIRDGLPDPTAPAVADTYGVAADVWELRALTAAAAGMADSVRVTSEKSGDLAATYAGPGKATGADMTPDRMRAIARQLRRRSCNAGPAQTVRVRTEAGLLEQPVRGGLYPSQLVN